MLEILVVDDSALMRSGLQCMLDSQPDLRVVGLADDGEAGLRQAQELRPGVVLMDLRMPGMDGIEATRRLKAMDPCPTVVVLTANCGSAVVRDAFAAGADGFLLKDMPPEQLLRALRDLPAGRPAVDPRVARVLRRLVRRAQQAAADEQSPVAAPSA